MWKCLCEGRPLPWPSGDKWPEIMSGDKSSSDVRSRARTWGWSPDTDPACVCFYCLPLVLLSTWDTENTLKTKQTLPQCCLTLFFHWKGTFLILLSVSVCCLSNVLPSDCGYCFPIVDDTVSPEHKCQCYWFKLRQNSILLTSQRSVFSSGYFVLTVHSAVLTLVTSLPITISPES